MSKSVLKISNWYIARTEEYMKPEDLDKIRELDVIREKEDYNYQSDYKYIIRGKNGIELPLNYVCGELSLNANKVKELGVEINTRYIGYYLSTSEEAPYLSKVVEAPKKKRSSKKKPAAGDFELQGTETGGIPSKKK